MSDLEELARLVGMSKFEIEEANQYVDDSDISGTTTQSRLDCVFFVKFRPVLLAAGCNIIDTPDIGAAVHWKDNAVICSPNKIESYATALANAVRWLAEHQPKELAEAVEKVRAGK